MDIKHGTRLKNRYEIIELLGTGGFAKTYKAVDHLVNRYVAIKCSEHSLAHEANILKALHNVPHICHLYDYFVVNGHHFIVMRLIKGTSLAAFQDENGGTINVSILKKMLPSVIITLDQMHDHGIIHRDISPGNFILTDENVLYLIDFGAATSIREKGLVNHLVFRHKGLDAPEFANIEKQGPWTDIYSLCRTIIYLITGEGVPDAMDRMVFDPVSSILAKSSISGKMQNALIKGLSLNDSLRYTSVLAFAKDFLGIDGPSTSKEKYSVHYHAKTFIGSRNVNQDNFMVDSLFAYAGEDCEIKGYIACDIDEYHIVAVADGVANSMHSELASKAAIQAISHFLENHQLSDSLPQTLVENLLDQINEKILTLSEKIGKTASTIALFLWKNNEYCVANIGDSPIYRLNGRNLSCLSNEHTLARQKIEQCHDVQKSDFNTLTRYLGKKSAGSQMAYIHTGTIKEGDIFLLCSDGVSKSLTERQIARYLKLDGDKTIAKMYQKCKKDPNMDNCTAVILKF